MLSTKKKRKRNGDVVVGLVDTLDGNDYYEVETLKKRRWNQKSKSYEYLVSWKGYSASFDTWEPTVHLRTTAYRLVQQLDAKLDQAASSKKAHQQKASKAAKSDLLQQRIPGTEHITKTNPRNQSKSVDRVKRGSKLRVKKKTSSTKKKRKYNGDVVVGLVDTLDGNDYYEVKTLKKRRWNQKAKSYEYLVSWKGYSAAFDTWEPTVHLRTTAYRLVQQLDAKLDQTASSKKASKAAKSDLLQQGIPGTEHITKANHEPQVAAAASEPPGMVAAECDTCSDVMTNIMPEQRKRYAVIAKSTQEGMAKLKKRPPPPSLLPSSSGAPPMPNSAVAPNDNDAIHFWPVPRWHVDDADIGEKVTAARLAGTPCCLVGHVGWAQFARPWCLPTVDGDDDDLDLATASVTFDVQRMLDQLGDEDVPVIRRAYDEYAPIQATTTLRSFVQHHWLRTKTSIAHPDRQLYLHQWQFPRSDTASSILCFRNAALPNSIFGEDLLCHWWDDFPDNPYQYLFMGRDDTMSRLHRDNGGLDITIAPIVGEKEVVMVHRADGHGCLYHLEANINQPDLARFPLMSFARAWKTVIRPGEILLMPQGTYHQCRNLTPCLSYSRFHLDTVNLKAFWDSMLAGDAPETEHADVIWNAGMDLIEAIDNYNVHVLLFMKKHRRPPSTEPPNVQKQLQALRQLRHLFRAIAMRPEECYKKDQHRWAEEADRIDEVLHHYAHREALAMPTFRKRTECTTSAAQQTTTGRVSGVVTGSVADNLEAALQLSRKFPAKMFDANIDNHVQLNITDRVEVRLGDRLLEGEILAVSSSMRAALVSFHGLPSEFRDEYVPITRLRSANAGETPVEVSWTDVRPDNSGLMYLEEGTGEEYAITVRSRVEAAFYLISLKIRGYKQIESRWLPRSSIIHKIASLNGSRDDDAPDDDVATPPGSPKHGPQEIVELDVLTP